MSAPEIDEGPTVAAAGLQGTTKTISRNSAATTTAPQFSEDAIALKFANIASQELRWTPSGGWMHDDGIVFTPDSLRKHLSIARQICRAEAKKVRDTNQARQMASAKTVAAVAKFASTDERLIVPTDDWDRDPLELNTPEGIVNLSTGRIRARDGDLVTQVTRTAPQPVACPLWTRFMGEVCCGDTELIEFLRRSAGYWLTGDRREQVIFFLYGAGANGKSVFVDVVQWIMNTYALALPAEVLMESKNDRHPTERAQLMGKRLAVSSELPDDRCFNEPLVKQLTGDETMNARKMRGDPFTFRLTSKNVMVGNHRPRLRGDDPAMARRLLLVPFNATFSAEQRDPNLLDKLKKEAPAILHWMIGGAVDWQKDGLKVPRAVRDESNDYIAEHDDVALWISERCVLNGRAPANALYADYTTWKATRHEVPLSATAWGTRLKKKPGIDKMKSSGIVYTGISLTTQIATK